MRLRDVFKGYTLDQDKVISPEETCQQVKAKLKETGLHIFQRTERIDQGRLGIPVYFSFYGEEGRRITGKRTQMGKGATAAQAEASALMELVERYSYFSFKQHLRHFVISTYNQISHPIPLELIVRSVHDEENLERAKVAFENIPLRWVRAYNLTRDEEMWIPFDWFVAINEFNGTSAGNELEEAIIQGLCEVVERHVCAVIAREKRSTPAIDPETIKDKVAKELLQKYFQAGVVLYLKDFSLDMGLPTVGILAYDPKTYPQSEIVFTAGTQTNPTKALIRALTETAQLAGDFLISPGYVPSGLPKPKHLEEVDYVIKTQAKTSILELPDISDQNMRIEIERAVAALKKRKYEVLVLDLTHEILKIPVVYVIVPGTYFWQRAQGASVPLFLCRVVSELYSTEEFIKILSFLQTIFPEHYAIPFYYGMVYFKQQVFDQAREWFKRALKAEPTLEDKAIILAYMGCCYKEKGEYKQAIAIFNESLTCDPEQKEVYNFIGTCYHQLGKYEEAIEAFQKAIVLDPHSAIDYANIGVSLEKIGKKVEAAFFYQQALNLDPSLHFARKKLEKLEGKEHAIR